MALLFSIGASEAIAQRAAPVLSSNVHGDKYETGGFGMGFLLGSMLSGNAYRAQVRTDIGGGGRLGDGQPLDTTQFVGGVSLAFQAGTDSDFVGTDISLDIVSHQVEISEPGGFGTITSGATVAKLGFDFIINFYKSEFIERDGRRTRDNFALSMLIGSNLGIFFGDFADLNGIGSIGLDLGLAMELPASDAIQFNPAMWLEMNYHLSDQVDVGTFDATDTGLNGNPPSTSRNLDGVLVRTHSFLPPYALNLGCDLVFTPLFVGERGNLINSWRFNIGLYLTAPVAFNSFAADLPGDPLFTDRSKATFVTMSFGASYFW